MLKAAFIFIAPGADRKEANALVPTEGVELTVVGVQTYDQGVAVAKELVDKGCAAIELCGGFGHKGTAAVVDAVAGKAAVGVVRFDVHPGLGNQSGDALF